MNSWMEKCQKSDIRIAAKSLGIYMLHHSNIINGVNIV